MSSELPRVDTVDFSSVDTSELQRESSIRRSGEIMQQQNRHGGGVLQDYKTQMGGMMNGGGGGEGNQVYQQTSGRRTSRVWLYFKMVDAYHYKCEQCKFVGTYTNTTNMRKHIQHHHPEIYEDILNHTRHVARPNLFYNTSVAYQQQQQLEHYPPTPQHLFPPPHPAEYPPKQYPLPEVHNYQEKNVGMKNFHDKNADKMFQDKNVERIFKSSFGPPGRATHQSYLYGEGGGYRHRQGPSSALLDPRSSNKVQEYPVKVEQEQDSSDSFPGEDTTLSPNGIIATQKTFCLIFMDILMKSSYHFFMEPSWKKYRRLSRR